MQANRTVTIVLEDDEIELALDILREGGKKWNTPWDSGYEHDKFNKKLIATIQGIDHANPNQ